MVPVEIAPVPFIARRAFRRASGRPPRGARGRRTAGRRGARHGPTPLGWRGARHGAGVGQATDRRPDVAAREGPAGRRCGVVTQDQALSSPGSCGVSGEALRPLGAGYRAGTWLRSRGAPGPGSYRRGQGARLTRVVHSLSGRPGTARPALVHRWTSSSKIGSSGWSGWSGCRTVSSSARVGGRHCAGITLMVHQRIPAPGGYREGAGRPVPRRVAGPSGSRAAGAGSSSASRSISRLSCQLPSVPRS